MTWRRAEVAASAASGGALVVALVLFAQDRQDRLVLADLDDDDIIRRWLDDWAG